MEISGQILSDVTTYMKYAKYLPDARRRETWEEIITRNKLMHLKKFPQLAEDIEAAYKYVYDKQVLPSMRSAQFAGKPIEINPSRVFNCAYTAIDDWQVFSEIMFLLLGGTGVGYSVQRHHIEKLPVVKGPMKRSRRYLIGDSIEGWADAIKVLMKAYFFGNSNPMFDYSDIRDKGAPLITTGGRAPGPQPLKDCIHNIRKVLDAKEEGTKLEPIEAHDIICYIADAVLSGGVRRAACLALFSIDDDDMMSCKFGNWWEKNPQRARANNSVMVLRHMISEDRFWALWDKVRLSGSGEPGIYFSNDMEVGTNPCAEISLKNNQFCNLTSVNVSNVTSQKDLDNRVRAAAFIGTLQASYTNFHYLRDVWQRNTEKDALLGVSMTGIASGKVMRYNLEEAAKVVVEENHRVADLIGINRAARATAIKPEGTASLVVGSSSGIHAWHAPYYIRRIRVNKKEAIYSYLKENIPELVEDEYFKPHLEAVISFPVKAPKGSAFRDEPALDLLNRVKKFSMEWIKPGYTKGSNNHNVSATISVKEGEWVKVGQWMWDNRSFYNGLTVLPFDGGSYVQAPFEDCSKDKYDELMGYVKALDLTQIGEADDQTSHKEILACSGGACEISF